MTPLMLTAAIAATAGALALALALVAFTAPQRVLETDIHIAAPPAQVWAILTDGAAYPDWNPFVRALSGEIAAGRRIETVMQPLGKKPMTFRPRILVAAPGAELRWLGSLGLPRIFDGEHYFTLHPEGMGTRLVQGERFRGLLLWVMPTEPFRASFTAMNEALKARAEAAEPVAARS